ncbi:hypothetical protein [Laspinema palackyanum]|uniref:hypothetical protein n=1 Tax=Laspinema palackyanum TaxID=3231601 RepID=UPI00345D5E3D
MANASLLARESPFFLLKITMPLTYVLALDITPAFRLDIDPEQLYQFRQFLQTGGVELGPSDCGVYRGGEY